MRNEPYKFCMVENEYYMALYEIKSHLRYILYRVETLFILQPHPASTTRTADPASSAAVYRPYAHPRGYSDGFSFDALQVLQIKVEVTGRGHQLQIVVQMEAVPDPHFGQAIAPLASEFADKLLFLRNRAAAESDGGPA